MYVASCIFSYPSSISANFDFPVSVALYGADGNLYSQPSNVSLSNNNLHYATSSSSPQAASNNIANFSIWFNTSGSYALGVLINSNTTIACTTTLQVLQERIIATNVSLVSNSTTHILKIVLSVLSNSSSSIESKHGPYNITFEPSSLKAWNST